MTAPPAADEYEVSLFGPGFGEAIALHVGNGDWILVDSCWLDPINLVPVSSSYLDSLGVPAGGVKKIVASHWHDDHVKGLSKLVEKYVDAELAYPGYLGSKEGLEFLTAYGGAVEPSTRGTKELFRSFKAASPMRRHPVLARHIVFEGAYAHGDVLVVAFSPTAAAWEKSNAAALARIHPGVLPRNIAEPKPNISSIVIHVQVPGDAILLGSDLESDGTLGWDAVLADGWASRRTKSSLYKVSHHGSATACRSSIWSSYVVGDPEAALTPFVNGSVRLPKADDVARIKTYTNKLTTTCVPGANLPRASEADRQLVTFLRNATGRSKRMGHVRYRKRAGAASWSCELLGAAQKL
jgi:hypothetical protein